MKVQHKYGVEIELDCSQEVARQIAVRCRELGVEVRNTGYDHRRCRSWKLVPDGSCGWEFVSPPMRDDVSLRLVCQAINEYETANSGSLVSSRCGLHVHHDARDFTSAMGLAALKSYATLEIELDKIMPRSRRVSNNNFSRSVMSLASDHRVNEAESMRDLANAFPTRYMKLNVQSFLRHGTIEFRHHAGTTDADKIWNWTLLTSGIMERARLGQTATYTTSFVEAIAWALEGHKELGRIAKLVVAFRKGMTLERAIEQAASFELSEGSVRKSYRFMNERVSWKLLRLPVDCRIVEYFIQRARKFGSRFSVAA